jgi:hypothetical protein
MSPEEYRRRLAIVEASFIKDVERAELRHTITSQAMRRRAVQSFNGGTGFRL